MDRLIDLRPAGGGGERLQAGETSFERAGLVIVAVLAAVLVGQVHFNACELRYKAAEFGFDVLFDLASQFFTTMNVVIRCHAYEHRWLSFSDQCCSHQRAVQESAVTRRAAPVFPIAAVVLLAPA